MNSQDDSASNVLTVKGGLDVQTTGARRVELLKVVNGVASPAKTRTGEKIETWLSMDLNAIAFPKR